MIAFAEGSFWDVRLGNILLFTAVLVAYLQYRLEIRKSDKERLKAREDMEKRQDERHQENQRRLDLLLAFQRNQEEINRKRDSQVDELKEQSITMAQIARGFEQRLEWLEDRRARDRNKNAST